MFHFFSCKRTLHYQGSTDKISAFTRIEYFTDATVCFLLTKRFQGAWDKNSFLAAASIELVEQDLHHVGCERNAEREDFSAPEMELLSISAFLKQDPE